MDDGFNASGGNIFDFMMLQTNALQFKPIYGQKNHALLSRSMMVRMSLLHSWVNFVEYPGLLPLLPQQTSSMFASGQITVRTVKASVPSSQKVSAVFVF